MELLLFILLNDILSYLIYLQLIHFINYKDVNTYFPYLYFSIKI